LKNLIEENTHRVTYQQIEDQLSLIDIPIAIESVCASEVINVNFSKDLFDAKIKRLLHFFTFWKKEPVLDCSSLSQAKEFLTYWGFEIRDFNQAFHSGIANGDGYDNVINADRLTYWNAIKRRFKQPHRFENIFLFSKGDRIVHAYNYEYMPNIGPSEAEK
jgi:hypothetical protein